jgi:hypothetical protein
MQAASNDVMSVVCGMLDGRSLATLSCVDQRMQRLVVRSHNMWRRLLEARFSRTKDTCNPRKAFAWEWMRAQRLYNKQRSRMIDARVCHHQYICECLVVDTVRSMGLVVWPCIQAVVWIATACQVITPLWPAMIAHSIGACFNEVITHLHMVKDMHQLMLGSIIVSMINAASWFLLFGYMTYGWPLWIVPLPGSAWCWRWWLWLRRNQYDCSRSAWTLCIVMPALCILLSFHRESVWTRMGVLGAIIGIRWECVPTHETYAEHILSLALVSCVSVWVVLPDQWWAYVSMWMPCWACVRLIIALERLYHVNRHVDVRVMLTHWNELASTEYLAGDDLPRSLIE